MENTQTPEQISKAAFAAENNARTAEQYLAVAEMHRSAMEQGNPEYKGGHSLGINRCTLLAKAKSNPKLAEKINRGLNRAAQIGL